MARPPEHVETFTHGKSLGLDLVKGRITETYIKSQNTVTENVLRITEIYIRGESQRTCRNVHAWKKPRSSWCRGSTPNLHQVSETSRRGSTPSRSPPYPQKKNYRHVMADPKQKRNDRSSPLPCRLIGKRGAHTDFPITISLLRAHTLLRRWCVPHRRHRTCA